MNTLLPYATTWQALLDVLARTIAGRGERQPPIILSSLPELPQPEPGRVPGSFIHGPPGRNIAVAIGLRAALPETPLLLIMNADSVTLGTNHLIHAARRNIGMTLLLLRSEVTTAADQGPLDRMQWGSLGFQGSIETRATPLDWATAMKATFVARGSLLDPDGLAALINQAIDTPGFSVIGVTAQPGLPLGVLSRHEWPEYFTAYREWTASFQDLVGKRKAPREPALPRPRRSVPRFEVRIAGLGGHGVKLAGTVLSEAAGLGEGLWATHRGEYGSATRGGPSSVDVVISSEPITYPGADNPDVLVVLSPNAAIAYATRLKPRAYLVADPDQISPLPVGALPVPMTRLAREHVGKPIAAGMVSLGCVAALSDVISLDSLRQSVSQNVPPRTIQANLAAVEAGYTATRDVMKGGTDEE